MSTQPQPTKNEHSTKIDIDLVQQFQVLELRYQELEKRHNQLKERFDFMQQATHDAVWDWDLVANRGWYSQGLKALFGYDQDDVGDGVAFWYNNIHPEDGPRVIKGIHDVIDTGGTHWSSQYRFKKADGTYAWIFDRGYAIHDASGKPIRMVGSMQDVTKNVAISDALKQSEQSVRLAVESAQLGTFDFDPVTGKLNWDKRCKELFGLSPDAYVDYDVFLKGLHPEDRDRTDAINKFAMSPGSGGHYDTEYRTIGIADQKLRWLRAKGQSYFDDNGMLYRYVGTVIDITAEKEREQLLREQEERFRLLATTIPQIVWTTNAEGVVDYISDKWQFYTGQTPDYQNGLFRSVIHDDDRPRIVAHWRECLEQGKELQFEYRLKNLRTGEYRWFKVSTVPLRDEQGKIIKWIGSATDIHDQKTIERNLETRVEERTKELRSLNVMLEKSNAELEQYAYVASHDLQEPLRKIQFYSSNIMERFEHELSTNVKEFVQKIDSSAARMSDLIKDLLAFSKLSSISTFEAVDLDVVFKEVLSDFELIIREKGIRIESQPLPSIKAIPVQMRQLFFNLIGNAIKFSKPETPNFIRVTCGELTQSEIECYPMLFGDSKHYKITVKDSGIGFNAKFNEQIFTIFQRLNHRKQFEGHGIGLALCRKIVGNHNGIIFSNGVENEGAEFTMILPERNLI